MPVPIMTGSAVIAMLLGLAIWTPGAAAASDGPTGIWATGDNDGAVEIRPCGGRLCGFIHTILRVPEPGRKLLDNRNEKPELRSRPLCGLQILGRLQKQAADTWGGGWIYDPNNGKTYNVEITVRGAGGLAVHGYLGITAFGRTLTWTRAGGHMPRCRR